MVSMIVFGAIFAIKSYLILFHLENVAIHLKNVTIHLKNVAIHVKNVVISS